LATPEIFKLLLDQNVPIAVARWLRSTKSDWSVVHTSEVGLSGAPDDVVFAWAQQEKAAVLTFDEDFADRRAFSVSEHFGIIRLRVWPTTVEEVQSGISRLIASIDVVELPRSLVIIDKKKIRIRRYP